MRAFPVVVAALCTGCALLSKADPLTPRFFSAEPVTVSAARARAPSPARRELRIGKVTSASYLGERLVYRRSASELGFYEDRRWTERPEAYFRRALLRVLYDEAGFVHLVSGAGPQLDVDLVEFSEVRGKDPVARVRAVYALYEGRAVIDEGTVNAEVPIAAAKGDAEAEAVVTALTQALENAVRDVVKRVAFAYPGVPP